MSITLDTPKEVAKRLAQRVRALRLARGWSQAELAERAGISVATYRVFERAGRISLERLLSIAIVLGRAGDLDQILKPSAAQSLDELDAGRPQRQRAARRRAE